MDDSLRLQRIIMAADIWGRVYLFHPGVPGLDSGLAWERAFRDIIPRIEKAEDATDLVRVLNDDLLKLLKDPLTFAQSVSVLSADDANREKPVNLRSPCEGIVQGALPGREDVGVIALTDPKALRKKGFLKEMGQALKSMADAESLILDLRWSPVFEGNLSGELLGFWVGSSCRPSLRITRAHRGWHELEHPYIYCHKWEIFEGKALEPPAFGRESERDPEASFTSGDPVFTDLPTLVLVNNGSILHFREALSALDALPDIRVAWEKTGRFSIPAAKSIRYPEGVEVHLCLEAQGFHTDYIYDEPIPESALPDLLSRAFTEPPRSHETSLPFHVSPGFRHSTDSSPSSVATALGREDRLLGLVKIWVILEHFYPFFDRADISPAQILPDWIPAVESAVDLRAYYHTLERLSAKLNDSHASVWHPVLQAEQSARVGFEFGVREGKLVIVSAPEGLPLFAGDEVIEIDGREPQTVMEEWRTRISASSERAFLRDLSWRICFGKEGEAMHLTVRRENAVLHKVVRYATAGEAEARAEPHAKGSKGLFAAPRCARFVRLLEGNLAIMTPFEMPSTCVLHEALEMIRDTAGLILDLRGYPKTHFQHELVRCLCSKTVQSPCYEVPLVRAQSSNEQHRILLRYSVEPRRGAGGSVQYDKPVVGLIDERVQSSAEDLCMYLRIAGRVVFVGLPTAGCHGNAAFVRLPAGGRMQFTGMRVTWPQGQPFQGIGIIPDVEVKPSIRALRKGSDEILEEGIAILKALVCNQASHQGEVTERSTKDLAQAFQPAC